ncbi:hypothetical protein cypCar_00046464 [Cyprinus carpio]|nr:hypothetical protein cypCar_00046464 [Cyprinus carpio]
MPDGAVRLSEKERKCRLKQVRTFSGNTDSSTTGTDRATGEEQKGPRRGARVGGCYMRVGRGETKDE